MLLAQSLAHAQLRLTETARAVDYAGAAVIRLGDPMLLADYLYARSLAEWSIGGAERALALEVTTMVAQVMARGRDHPRVAEAQNAIAVSLVELERIEAGVTFERAALAMRELLQGPEHPEALNARGNLAFALAEAGQIAEALVLQESVAEARARVLGPDYFLLDETWIRLSRLYQWELGRADDALRAARRAVALDDAEFGLDAPEAIAGLTNLARVLVEHDELTEADEVSARALEIAERTLPATHLLRRGALAARGIVLERGGRCGEAIELLERLDEASRASPSGRAELVLGLQARARCAVRSGARADAEALLVRALAIREDSRGADSPMIAGALIELAAFYRAEGRTADAVAAASRAVERRAHTPGVIQARARFELAQALWPVDRAAAIAEAERAHALLAELPASRLRDELGRWTRARRSSLD